VVELGRRLGWAPLPLSVRDARRRVGPIRERLARDPAPRRPAPSVPGQVRLRARAVAVSYGDVAAVRGADVNLRDGEIVALMGRNGSGKSSLLWALQGSGRRQAGVLAVSGPRGEHDPHQISAAEARHLVGLVPQQPADLLYLGTVADELAQADREAGRDAGHTRALLDRLAPGVTEDVHPRDLSEGQRLSLVLAIQLSATPGVVLLDEPTRGLDYSAKRSLTRVVEDLAAAGHAVVIATHDVEFAAATARRVVVLADGDVVADGAADEILMSSPTFAPQVAKIFAPLPFLTVDELSAAVG
jgi:energy-coupling factor transport system ATP-binding protein